MNEDIVAFLRGVPFFREMLLKELTAIAFYCESTFYPAEATILYENMPGKGLHIIKDGAVSIVKKQPTGREKAIALLKAPDFFGEMSLLSKAPVSATVYAAEDCNCFLIKPTRFEELITKNQEVGIQLLLVLGRVLAHRLREANQRNVHSVL